jgi:23S rRNA pseudouridine1911/1915/1917 synthase
MSAPASVGYMSVNYLDAEVFAFVCYHADMNTPETQVHEFTSAQRGERLDKIVVAQLGDALTRSQIQALIKGGEVTVNGKIEKPGVKLKGGELIRVIVPPLVQDETVEPEPIELDVIYEDDDLAVINKRAGLVVHPGTGNPKGTLVNAILARYPQIAEMNYHPNRRGIVHRLDKETSGLILIAKKANTLHKMMQQFQARTVEKVYLTLVEKLPKTPTGRIDLPIARDPKDRKKMSVQLAGRPALSEFAVLETFENGQTLVQIRLLTGRTHQIRVHMAYIGAPVVGDRVYGYRKQRISLKGQFLHAAKLCFDHPRTGERLCFESPLPPHLEAVLANLRKS